MVCYPPFMIFPEKYTYKTQQIYIFRQKYNSKNPLSH